jgi:hypothetical protein
MGKIQTSIFKEIYECLEDVDDFITKVVNATSKKQVMSICGYGYIFSNNIWTML